MYVPPLEVPSALLLAEQQRSTIPERIQGLKSEDRKGSTPVSNILIAGICLTIAVALIFGLRAIKRRKLAVESEVAGMAHKKKRPAPAQPTPATPPVSDTKAPKAGPIGMRPSSIAGSPIRIVGTGKPENVPPAKS